LWCKKKSKDAIFADITRVAIVDIEATEKQIKVHQIVRKAQKDATDYIQSQLSQGRMVKGCDVDRVARTVIEDAGYGIFFIHRTGHNIHTKLHGPGAHLDSLETLDERFLIPRTCFSIEPGIYLPNEFGIRQEYDVYISSDNKVSIFGGFQDFITSLV